MTTTFLPTGLAPLMALRQSTAMGFSTPGIRGMMGVEPVAQTTAS